MERAKSEVSDIEQCVHFRIVDSLENTTPLAKGVKFVWLFLFDMHYVHILR